MRTKCTATVSKKYLQQIVLWTLLLCLLPLGCKSSSSDDSSDGGLSGGNATSFTTLCGVSILDRLVNPFSGGERVSATVIDSDTVIIQRLEGSEAGNQQLVKLQGVTSDGVNSFRVANGVSLMSQRLAGGAIFVSPGDGCEVTVDGGGMGVLGQLFSLAGESMSELMLQQGAVVPIADICGGDELAACYSTIGVIARPPSDVELDLVSVNLPSQCGAVKDSVVINPVTAAEEVLVDVSAVNEVVITRLRGIEAGNSQAIKLQGLSTDGVQAFRLAQGVSFLASQTSGGAFLVVADQGCQAQFPGGGLGVFGQLYSLSGASLNEELIRQGSAVPTSDSCGGSLILPCYQSIEVDAPDEGISDQIIDDFLWKPVSERDGNLVILVNPTGVTVVVNNQTLTNFGPSNGRGTTARANRSGCAFGSNIRVDFFDRSGRRIFIADGRDSVTVPNGCDRLEFRL